MPTPTLSVISVDPTANHPLEAGQLTPELRANALKLFAEDPQFAAACGSPGSQELTKATLDLLSQAAFPSRYVIFRDVPDAPNPDGSQNLVRREVVANGATIGEVYRNLSNPDGHADPAAHLKEEGLDILFFPPSAASRATRA